MAEEEGEITFEEQLALEKEEKSRQQEDAKSEKVKVDDDGTVYDWDADKKAWFPRINEDFIARYQMSYGADVQSTNDKSAQPSTDPTPTAVDFASIPPPPDANDPSYTDWYYRYGVITTSQEYRDWYNYYYGDQQSDGDSETQTLHTDSAAAPSNPHDESYWEQLKEQGGIEPAEATSAEAEDAKAGNKKGKKKKEKPPPKPASWFDMQEEDNTNVYITGLPPSITLDGMKELANKCGLIAFDPITKKPKLKLYKDSDGNPKGDGLVCYIKQESVDLALTILDGYVLDGHTLSAKKAVFEMKGNYDPSKRKRKLTNKEKKAFREKQAKLFEWRPDKPRFARSRHEKTVIVKNVFSLQEVDKNILLVNELEEDLTAECAKYGQVKKVKVYERNPEGVVSITFNEAEEADVCKEALNGRWFACRQLKAETWDGKAKYFIEETEEEYKERLKKWEQYLEKGQAAEAGVASASGARPVRNVPGTAEAGPADAQPDGAAGDGVASASGENTSSAAESSPAQTPPHEATGAESDHTVDEMKET